MKKIILIAIFLCVAAAAFAAESFPSYTGYVNDFSGILSPAEKSQIESLCSGLKKETGAELAVVTVKTTDPLDVKTYAVKLFEKWKIGQKGKDNGVLVLLSMGQRRVEVEVGYGLEGILPDGRVGEILDNDVIPSFKQNKYGEGLYNGCVSIAKYIRMDFHGEKIPVTTNNADNLKLNLSPLAIIIAIIVFIIVIIFSIIGGFAGHMIGALIGMVIGYIIAGVVGAFIGFAIGMGGWGSIGMFGGGFGGGGFGGGGGGGFGGFGGGSSGGGGSGRSF